MHDLVIDNALVIDGLGGTPVPGGVAVQNGRIVAVGPDLGPARERERGDLTLPEAVKRVTSDVAGAYRIKDRGRLVPGAWADLLLFDPRTVGRGAKRRVPDLPTGASRLDTPAVGLHGVWVNGVRTVGERGVLADCGRPGRVLRDFAD